jgi:hypothetical protein
MNVPAQGKNLENILVGRSAGWELQPLEQWEAQPGDLIFPMLQIFTLLGSL